MLQVCIHHRQKGCRARKESFYTGRSQTATSNPVEAAHTPIPSANLADHVSSPVWRIVIDEQNLPRNAGKATIQLLNNMRNVFALLESWDDDG
jgi:hypothetical protein